MRCGLVVGFPFAILCKESQERNDEGWKLVVPEGHVRGGACGGGD